MRALLERGANIEAVNKEGETALNVAAANNQTAIFGELLARGGSDGDLETFQELIKNDQGDTALHYAVSRGSYNVSSSINNLVGTF